MAGPHHQYNEHEFGQTLGDGEGQGDLACCSPWGHEELDTTRQLNNNNGSSLWTDAKAEAAVFWPSDANRQLIGKVLDAGKD